MMWLVYLLLICVGLFLNNTRVYTACVAVFFGLLAWNNTDAADYASVYLPMYLNPTGVYDIDPGWSVLCQIGAAVGLSYNGFACIMAVASVCLFAFAGKRLGVNTSFVLALLLIYPGLMSLVQFRQFVASAIGAIGIVFLFSDSKHRYIKFLTVTLCAFLVHRSAIVVLALLLWPMLRAAGRRGRALLLIVLVGTVVFVMANVQEVASFFFGDFKTAAYLQLTPSASNAVSALGGARNAVLLFSMPMLIYLCAKIVEDENVLVSSGITSMDYDYYFFRSILFFNLALLILFPLVFITNDFMRFERYAFSYSIYVFAMMPCFAKRHPILSCKALYIVVCLVYAYTYVVAGTFDLVYTPLLSIETFPAFFL